MESMKFLNRTIVLGCGLWMFLVLAQAEIAPGHYSNYQKVLAGFVDAEGSVDYRRLKAERKDLVAFLDSLPTLSPAVYDEWPSQEKIAFWINAYNGCTLKLIIDHYPIRSSFIRSLTYPRNSIRQIPGAWKKITFSIMGEKLTLDHIEHTILRAQFDEPGIHMALVCAARSCPRLRQEPYAGERLEEQLADQAREFLSSPRNFAIDPQKNVVYLSSIFKWYKKDFVSRYAPEQKYPGLNLEESSIIGFVLQFIPAGSSDFLEQGGYKIKYRDYDWTLNAQEDP